MARHIRSNPALIKFIERTYFRREPAPSLPLLRKLLRIKGLDVSVKTLRRHFNGKHPSKLRRRGLRHSTDHCRKRLRFAQAVLNDLDTYKNLAFSDEKKFIFSGSICAPKVWLKNKEDQRHIVDSVAHPMSVMMHGVVTFTGKQLLTAVPSGSDGCTVNGSYYADLVDERIAPFVREHEVIFQQDNASPHVCAVAIDALRQITYLTNWPPRSPDFSPIEHLWAVVSGKVETYFLERPGPVDRSRFEKVIYGMWREACADRNVVEGAWNRCLRAIKYSATHGGRCSNKSH